MVEEVGRRAQGAPDIISPADTATVSCRSFECRGESGETSHSVRLASLRLEVLLDEELLVGSWSYAVPCPSCGEEIRGRLADVYAWALAGVGCPIEVF